MAAKLQCEICGGKLIGRPGGVFECDSCGMEYDTAWAKAKIQEITGTVKVEGTVEVTGKVQVDGPVKVEGGVNKEALLKRGRLALEDGQWGSAKESFNQALTMEAEFADAWLGLAMAELKLKNESGFAGLEKGFASVEGNADYQKFVRFASPERRQEVSVHLDAAEAEKQRREAERQRREAERQEQEKADAAARAAFSKELPALRKRIAPAQHLIAEAGKHVVCLTVDGSVLVAGDNDPEKYQISDWKNIKQLAIGWDHTVGLTEGGTVFTAGKELGDGRMNVKYWDDIVQVAVGQNFSIGLKENGTVRAAGPKGETRYNSKTFEKYFVPDTRCDVEDWKDIAKVYTGRDCTIGLKKDGTLVATGMDSPTYAILYGKRGAFADIREHQNVVDVIAYPSMYVLKADGTAGTVEKSARHFASWTMSRWRDLVEISADNHVIGLKSDGTVVAVGANDHGECSVSDWREIIAVETGQYRTYGLKRDGTVVATGENGHGECDVSGWTDVVAIKAGRDCVAGLRADGTLLIAGDVDDVRDTVSKWRLFQNIDTLEAEHDAARVSARAEWEKRRDALNQEKNQLEAELSQLKGLFVGKQRAALEAKIHEVELQIAVERRHSGF